MRVLIDASPLLLKSAGVKNYYYHWLVELRRQAGADAIRIFPFLEDLGDLDHEQSVLTPFQTYPRLAAMYLARLGLNAVVEFAAHGAGIFHVSNIVRNRLKHARLTATVFDLTCQLMPQFHTVANVEADRGYIQQVLRHADGLIAISESTKQDAVRLIGVAPEKVHVIYPGIADTYFDAAPMAREKPYVLCVGTLEPRKNVGILLDAYEQLPRATREQFDLILAGPPGWHSEAIHQRLRGGIEGVRYLGYVPERDLPGLTAGATALAYPSLYEGFGFPAAQAMAAGVPVVTSNTSSLPEVVGAGGIAVDPRSVVELSAALERVLTSPALRMELGANGKRLAQQFRWERCASLSLKFFERVSGG